MRISHHVVISNTPEERQTLARLGFDVSGTGLIVAFDVYEDDSRWQMLSAWLTSQSRTTLVETHFSDSELAAAEWLSLRSDWYHGYPEPDIEHDGYKRVTYDPEKWCVGCNCGKVQKAQFQMKNEPKWGKKGLLMMNWVFDEIFVKPEVYESVFLPLGVRCRPVLDNQLQELKTVVQLAIDETVELNLEGLPFSTCERCQRRKYEPVVRGMEPAMHSIPNSSVVRTGHYSGFGGNAFRSILVSKAVLSKLNEAKVRGFRVAPLSPI